jgi:hypothetical protein
MNTQKTPLLGVVVLGSMLLTSSAACKQGNSLSPIADVSKTLTAGINAANKGTPLEKAFPGMEASAKPGVVERLRAVKAQSIVLLGMELEYLFYLQDAGTYYLRTLIHPGSDGPALLQFAGRVPENGKIYVSGQPFESYTGAAAPFARAGKSYLELIRKGACDQIPIARAEPLQALLPEGKVREQLMRGLNKTRAELKQNCDAARSAKADKILLRIDDVIFGTVGADGKFNGMISADLEHKDGKLRISIGRLRPL